MDTADIEKVIKEKMEQMKNSEEAKKWGMRSLMVAVGFAGGYALAYVLGDSNPMRAAQEVAKRMY